RAAARALAESARHRPGGPVGHARLRPRVDEPRSARRRLRARVLRRASARAGARARASRAEAPGAAGAGHALAGQVPAVGARAAQAERAYEALSAVFGLDTTIPARFVWKRRDPRYRLLLEATLGLRFDAIAAGAQRMVEESLLTWARLMRERHGGERLALGGGVFMNVKANGRLADEPWLRDLFVFPSCGDES